MASLKPKFFQIDFSLVQFLGCHVRAVVYARLTQWQEYANAQEWGVNEQGEFSFYRLGQELVDETLVKERTLRAILTEFKDKGWLKIERKGFDPKVWYTFFGAPELSKNGIPQMQILHSAKCKNGIQANAKFASAQVQNLHVDLTINKEIKKEIKEDLCKPPPKGASSPPKIQKDPAAVEVRKPKAKNPKPKSEGAEVWDVYALGFQKRYATTPIRNARVNAQLNNFIAAVGLKTALRIASWYVSRSDSFLVSKCHPIGLMITDAQKWDVESQHKRAITRFDAKSVELNEHNSQVFSDARVMQDLDINPFDIFDEPSSSKRGLVS